MLHDNPAKRKEVRSKISNTIKANYKQGLRAGFQLIEKVAYKIKPYRGKCEDCGSTKNIKLHHIDGNQSNHLKTNIEMLCTSCHVYKHYQPYMTARVKFDFVAGHHLPGVEICEREHGHNYKLEVKVGGRLNKQCMVRNFKEIKAVVKNEVLGELDHQNLNNILSNMPTAEVTCLWIFKVLNEKLKGLKSIRLYETDGCDIELDDEYFMDMIGE